MYGSTANTGRLEVRLDGVWGTVCDRSNADFSEAAATIACRQLGYGQSKLNGNAQFYTNSTPSTELPIVMADVTCPLGVTRLQDCTFSRNTGGCTHIGNDVGVECNTCRHYLCGDGQCVEATQCNKKRECNDGSDENEILCSE